MIILHDAPSSIHGAKIRIILHRKGLDWSEGDAGDLCAKTGAKPFATMPVLIDEALKITQPGAMAEYLEDICRAPSMLPDDLRARAKARELSDFLDTRLVPAVCALAGSGQDATDAGNAVTAELAGLAALVDRRRYQRRGSRRPPPLRSESVPLLLGDCGYPAACAWIETLSEARGLDIEIPGAVRAYLDMLEAMEAVSRTMAPCRTAMQDWIAAQCAAA